VQKTKEKGGTPILVTSMHRHRFEGDKVVNSLRDYPDMVRQAAAEEHVALIDLHAMSGDLYEALGPKGSIQLFKHDSDNDPKFDATHHSPYGAYELAKCVVLGIQQAKVDLAKHVAEDVSPLDPKHPDPVAEFKIPASPGVTKQRPLGD
jgi:hypothetical protein